MNWTLFLFSFCKIDVYDEYVRRISRELYKVVRLALKAIENNLRRLVTISLCIIPYNLYVTYNMFQSCEIYEEHDFSIISYSCYVTYGRLWVIVYDGYVQCVLVIRYYNFIRELRRNSPSNFNFCFEYRSSLIWDGFFDPGWLRLISVMVHDSWSIITDNLTASYCLWQTSIIHSNLSQSRHFRLLKLSGR